MQRATAVNIPTQPTERQSRSYALRYRLLGLVLMSATPALFWTGLLALGSWTVGKPISATTLASVGLGIAVVGYVVACFAAVSSDGSYSDA